MGFKSPRAEEEGWQTRVYYKFDLVANRRRRAADRFANAMDAPALAKAFVVARPMPEPAPVTGAT